MGAMGKQIETDVFAFVSPIACAFVVMFSFVQAAVSVIVLPITVHDVHPSFLKKQYFRFIVVPWLYRCIC